MSDIGRNYLEFMNVEVPPVQEGADKPVEEENKPDVQEVVTDPLADKPEDVQEQGGDPTDPPAPEDTDPIETKPTTPELDDNTILAYLKQKSGKELSSIDDLFKDPEPVSDPFTGMSEKTQQFLKFNKETGRDYDDFLRLDTDYTGMSPLRKAQLKAIEFSEGELTESDVNEYLEKELGIDLTDAAELDKFDNIKLKGYARDWEKQKIQEQEKYKQPIEKAANKDNPELVSLEDGTMLPVAVYEARMESRNQYLNDVKAASDNIKASVFQVKFDNNGTEQALALSYDYTKDEVRNMAESALDIDKTFKNLFGNEKGIDYAKLQEGLHWAKESNREKMVADIVHKAWAEWTKQDVKQRTNANFSPKRIPNNKQTKTVPIPGTQNDYGVKYDFDQFKT